MSKDTSKKRPPTIAIDPDNYETMTSLYQKSDSKSMVKFGNQIIEDYIEKQSFLKRFAPHLSLHKIEESQVSLIDEHLDKIIKVTFRDNRLWCSECKPKTCMHLFYVIGSPHTGSLVDDERNIH